MCSHATVQTWIPECTYLERGNLFGRTTPAYYYILWQSLLTRMTAELVATLPSSLKMHEKANKRLEYRRRARTDAMTMILRCAKIPTKLGSGQ